MRSALLIAVAMLAACCSTAGAATPFTAGATGLDAKVAVSTDGTAHVAWLIPATVAAPGAVGYCRVLPGASACGAGSRTIAFPPRTGERATPIAGTLQVFAPSATTRAIIFAACTGCGAAGVASRVYQWSSTDTGATFPGPSNPTSDPLRTPTGRGFFIDGAVGFVTPVQGSKVVAYGNGNAPVDAAPAGFGAAAVNYVVARDVLVFAASNGAWITTSVYSGDINNSGLINTQAKWPAPIALPAAEPAGAEPSLAASTNGLALVYRWGPPGDRHIGARAFSPMSLAFGAPVSVTRGEPVDDLAEQPVAAADDGGTIHAVWRSGYGGGRLRYAPSATGGASFGAPGTIAAGEDFQAPDVAAGPDGQALAVWRAGGAGGPIRVVRVQPAAEPYVPRPGATPAPVPKAASRLRTRTVTVLGGKLTLSVPRACVKRGGSFKAALAFARSARKSARFAGVRKVEFSLAGKRVATDSRAPFTQRLRIDKKARRGSTVKVGVRAFVKVKQGKAPRTSIRTTVGVCR